jgi:hypothetical protein
LDEYLLTCHLDPGARGPAEFPEDGYGTVVPLFVSVDEDISQGVIEALKEFRVTAQSVWDELELLYVSRGIVDRVFGYQYHLLVVRVGYAQLVKNIRIPIRAVGDNNVRLRNVLVNLIEQRDGQYLRVSPLAVNVEGLLYVVFEVQEKVVQLRLERHYHETFRSGIAHALYLTRN